MKDGLISIMKDNGTTGVSRPGFVMKIQMFESRTWSIMQVSVIWFYSSGPFY